MDKTQKINIFILCPMPTAIFTFAVAVLAEVLARYVTRAAALREKGEWRQPLNQLQ